MEPVFSVSLVSFVDDDADDLAFLRVELHLPLSFPFLQGLKNLLDGLCIGIDKQAVACKEARIRGSDSFWEVDNEGQEKQWAQNCSLWYARDHIGLQVSAPVQYNLLLSMPTLQIP